MEREIPGRGYGCRGDSAWDGKRSELPAVFYRREEVSLRRSRMGEAHGADREREGRDDLPAGRRGSSEELVADGDEHRHQQVFPWKARDRTARRIGAATDRAWVKHHRPGGRMHRIYSRHGLEDHLPRHTQPPPTPTHH